MGMNSSALIALRSLRRNKLQTALTMLGMTFGVATVLTMIALGTGAQRAIQDQVKAAGMNTLIVTAGNFQARKERPPDDAIEMGLLREPNALPNLKLAAFHPEDDPFAVHDHQTARSRLGDSEAGLGAAATLTIPDADAIRNLPGVQYVCGGVHENVHVVSGDQRWFTRVHGDDSTLPEIRRAWTFVHGQFFSARQERNKDQVAVLGAVVATRLFGDANPVGKTITLWKQTFQVVGVVTSSSWLMNPAEGDDQFDAVYIPVTTMHSLLNLSKLNDITITTQSTGDVSHVESVVTSLLRKRHNIGADAPDDFTVASQAAKALSSGGLRPDVATAVTGNVNGLEKVTLDQLGKTLDRSSATMSALLASIATVSLIVGGIGIMNIMMLSVTERTREIGIRRAVGARAHDVLTQFILESIILSVAGGLLGIGIGVVASIGISRSAHWSTSISPMSIVISFGISAAIGIFFGFYPAREASRVAPLQSLRFE